MPPDYQSRPTGAKQWDMVRNCWLDKYGKPLDHGEVTRWECVRHMSNEPCPACEKERADEKEHEWPANVVKRRWETIPISPEMAQSYVNWEPSVELKIPITIPNALALIREAYFAGWRAAMEIKS
jgi:hypothetical protein